MTIVTDLIQGRDGFPIPVQEDFGGDVIVGWRCWGSTRGKLFSPNVYCAWTPGQPMSATNRYGVKESAVPSFATSSYTATRGVYCRGSKEEAQAKGYSVFGEVALWGTVLDFRGGKVEGAIGQYGYPLSLYALPGVLRYFGEWAATGVELYDSVTETLFDDSAAEALALRS